jgi:hypothetical protein
MDRYGKPIYPAIEVILIIKPDFCVRICGNAAFITSIGPKRLVSKLISSEGISSNGPVIPTPALLITISNLPELAMILQRQLESIRNF